MEVEGGRGRKWVEGTRRVEGVERREVNVERVREERRWNRGIKDGKEKEEGEKEEIKNAEEQERGYRNEIDKKKKGVWKRRQGRMTRR